MPRACFCTERHFIWTARPWVPAYTPAALQQQKADHQHEGLPRGGSCNLWPPRLGYSWARATNSTASLTARRRPRFAGGWALYTCKLRSLKLHSRRSLGIKVPSRPAQADLAHYQGILHLGPPCNLGQLQDIQLLPRGGLPLELTDVGQHPKELASLPLLQLRKARRCAGPGCTRGPAARRRPLRGLATWGSGARRRLRGLAAGVRVVHPRRSGLRPRRSGLHPRSPLGFQLHGAVHFPVPHTVASLAERPVKRHGALCRPVVTTTTTAAGLGGATLSHHHGFPEDTERDCC